MVNKDIVYLLSWGLFIGINVKLFNLIPIGANIVVLILGQLMFYGLYLPFAMDSFTAPIKDALRFAGWPHLLIYVTLDYINDVIANLIPKRDNLDELLRLYIIKSLREKGFVDFDLFKLAYPPKRFKQINKLFKLYKKELNLIPTYEDGLIIYRRESNFID